MVSEATRKLAVLIDADNAQSSMASVLLAEVARHGIASVKRAYGDWTGNYLKGWKEVLLENSIQPIQQFAYTQGKNSTDAAMVIDAMDLLYTNRFDGFCIVSSDSDFTRLASRIRESGLVVFGFGERKTPQSLVTACDQFIYMDNLSPKARLAPQSSTLSDRTDPPSASMSTDHSMADDYVGPLHSMIRGAIEATSDDSGWAGLASVGSLIIKWQPDFDARSFGYEKLSHLIRADPSLEVVQRVPGEGKPPVMYVRVQR